MTSWLPDVNNSFRAEQKLFFLACINASNEISACCRMCTETVQVSGFKLANCIKQSESTATLQTEVVACQLLLHWEDIHNAHNFNTIHCYLM